MGHFRFSIGRLMVVVAVLALDFAVGRAWSRSLPNSNLDVVFFFGLPMLNILAIGFVTGRRWQGRARAFWIGFEGFGCLAVAALALDVLANHRRALHVYEELVAPVLDGLESFLNSFGSKDWHTEEPWFWLVDVPLLFCITLPPLLLPALVGGWIVSRLSPNHVSDRDSCGVSGASRNTGDRDREGPLV